MQPDLSWVGVLEHHARRTPDKPIAVRRRGRHLPEMTERAAALATGLQDLGVGRGDVVGLLSYNSLEFLEVIFAANHLGAVAMPINWRLAAAEVAFILEHSQARAFVCDEELLELSGATPPIAWTTARCGWRSRRTATTGGSGWPTSAPTATSWTGSPVEGDDLHRLMYTSGTTGRPKGVMLTHANLAWKNFAHVTELGVTADDIGLACGPLYHVGALDLITTTMIAVGATTMVHRVFDAEQVVEEIERSRVTCMWTAPAMVRAILEVPGVEERDLSSVRLIIAGGEKMPIPFIERLRRTFPSAWFADAYGLTETVSGDTFLDRYSTLSKLGSVGRACPYLDLEIWDEPGRPVPAGERGEVVLRGPKVFKGYWRDPEATATAFAGGWFHTGDVGVLDEDGFVYIVDRLKDMIVSGGENIAGSEVERVLYEHPSVVEAAVVARPDEQWGEVPVAYVVLAEGVDGHPRRAHRPLPRATGQVQGPQGRDRHRRPAEEPVRQGPQAGAARRAEPTFGL